MNFQKILLITGAIFLLSVPVMAADIYVPADYTTIQAAIDAAAATSGGDRIFVAPGTYQEYLTIDGINRLKLIGAGRAATIIEPPADASTGNLITVTDSNRIVIKKFTIRNARSGENIFMDVCNYCTVANNLVDGAGNDGLQYDHGIGLKVLGNTFSNNAADGIAFEDTSNENIIIGNICDNNGDNGIFHYYGSYDLISGNTCTNNQGNGIQNEYGSSVKIIGNTVTDNTSYGINENSYGDWRNKIARNTVLRNGSSGIYGYMASRYIRNTVRDNGYAGMYIDYNGIVIKNRVTGNDSDGIYINDAYWSWVEANYADGNGLGTVGDGIYLYGYSHWAVDNVVINNGDDGISNDEDVVWIIGNFVDNNVDTGIDAYFDSVMVTDNTCTSNGRYGIYTNDYANVLMRNVVTDNGDDGISSYCWACTYKRNRVRRNAYDGIEGFQGSKLVGNVVTGNIYNGFYPNTWGGSIIRNNTALGNGDGMKYFDLYDGNDPLLNYWQNNTFGTADWLP